MAHGVQSDKRGRVAVCGRQSPRSSDLPSRLKQTPRARFTGQTRLNEGQWTRRAETGHFLQHTTRLFKPMAPRTRYYYATINWKLHLNVRVRACASICARVRVSECHGPVQTGGWVAVPIGCCSPNTVSLGLFYHNQGHFESRHKTPLCQ